MRPTLRRQKFIVQLRRRRKTSFSYSLHLVTHSPVYPCVLSTTVKLNFDWSDSVLEPEYSGGFCR